MEANRSLKGEWQLRRDSRSHGWPALISRTARHGSSRGGARATTTTLGAPETAMRGVEVALEARARRFSTRELRAKRHAGHDAHRRPRDERAVAQVQKKPRHSIDQKCPHECPPPYNTYATVARFAR